MVLEAFLQVPATLPAAIRRPEVCAILEQPLYGQEPLSPAHGRYPCLSMALMAIEQFGAPNCFGWIQNNDFAGLVYRVQLTVEQVGRLLGLSRTAVYNRIEGSTAPRPVEMLALRWILHVQEQIMTQA